MKHDDIFPGSTRLVEGVPPPSSLLLIGPSGVGKTIFCKQFAYSGLKEGEPCVYVATSESPQEIEKSMKRFGFDVESYKEDNLFRIVDCYSWKIGGSSISKWVVTNPGDLASISTIIENAMRGLVGIRLVFDSITGLTSISNYNPTYFSKLLQIIAARVKSLNGRAIFVAAPEAHDQKFVSYLRQMFEGTLEMKGDDSGKEIKRLLRIFSLKGGSHKTFWMPFEITAHGIAMENEIEARCMMCSRLIQGEPILEVVAGKKYSFDSADCAKTYNKLKSVYGENFE